MKFPVVKTKFNAAKAKRKLDKLLSQYILGKHNRTCQRCNKQSSCDTCHIIPRQVLSLRWNEQNILCMCKSCHKWSITAFHQSPLSFTRWFDAKYPRLGDILLSCSVEPLQFNEQYYNSTKAALTQSGSLFK